VNRPHGGNGDATLAGWSNGYRHRSRCCSEVVVDRAVLEGIGPDHEPADEGTLIAGRCDHRIIRPRYLRPGRIMDDRAAIAMR
jgi:hypothetical protein